MSPHPAYKRAARLRQVTGTAIGRSIWIRAAAAYLVYGVLYEGFAAWSIARHGPPPGLTYTHVALFLGIGAVFALGFPFLLLRGYRWFARLLSILIAMRVAALVAILAGVQLHSLNRELFFLKRMSSPGVYGISLLISLLTLWMVAVPAWRRLPNESF